MNEYRTETDLLGEVQVPAQALYGAQTKRAIENFPLHGEKKFSDYPELLRAMLIVKKAAALANLRTGCMEEKEANSIMEAVDELLADLPEEAFPVHAFHGGGCISYNMNINEVLANLANRKGFDQPLGCYSPLHPNDHINLNQSTNDVVAAACHMAIIEKFKSLEAELSGLSESFTDLGKKYKGVQKISRTCLQDAVEIGWDDFFSGYSAITDRSSRHLAQTVNELYCLSMGGTLVGRKTDVDPRYFETIIPTIQEICDSDRYHRTTNLFDATQNLDDMIHVASQIKILAQALIKIGKDLRLMSSGPQTGFCEITLPAIQAGSSAMPGKINPSVPEFLVQCCFMAIGRCCSAEIALEHGELELNIWEATVVINILDAMSAIESGIRSMRINCVPGIVVNIKRNRENINSLIPLMTRIKMEKGYSFATRAYKEFGGNYEKLKTILAEPNQ